MSEEGKNKHKAVFLDRDGVINHSGEDYYMYKPEHCRLNPGVREALKTWQKQGYLLIIITNQGGIARGIYSKGETDRIHAMIREQLALSGVQITDVYYCPHHDSVGQCLCRKPSGLLISRAMARYNIDPAQSVMIGDSARDIEAAEDAGIRGIRLPVNGDLRKVSWK